MREHKLRTSRVRIGRKWFVRRTLYSNIGTKPNDPFWVLKRIKDQKPAFDNVYYLNGRVLPFRDIAKVLITGLGK